MVALEPKAVARMLALYLPQFHPIPENDEWWGEGFTEWTNVAKARPLFKGHWQPRLPGKLGFYDLRLAEIREQQAKLARESGIEGFCYWHYWFGDGRRILERPFEEVLHSGKPDFPFCLAWANQSWSGIWHGNPNKVLIEQRYPGDADEKAHFELLLPAFKDRRYVKVDGKPVFAIYDPSDHPDLSGFISHWRALAQEAGLTGIYFIAMWNGGPDPRLEAFDAFTEFGPGDFLKNLPEGRWAQRLRRWRQGDFNPKIVNPKRVAFLVNRLRKPQRFRYGDVVRQAFTREIVQDPRFIPTVLPGWDNTPRSGSRGVVFEGSTPNLFHDYIVKAIRLVMSKPQEQRLIFLKAWNEWAEGNYVEPDTKFGQQNLEVIKLALEPDEGAKPC